MQSAALAEPSSVMSGGCCQTAHPGENHSTVKKWSWQPDRKAFVWITGKTERPAGIKT